MKRTAAVGAAGAVAIVIVVYALWPRDREHSARTPPHAAPAVVEPGASATAPDHAGRAPALATRVDPYPEHGIDGVSTDDPLTAYRRANVYPPTSRPLSAEHADLLAPNQRHETARPTDADDGTMFLFTADRYFVIGDEALTATLEVWRDHTPIAPAIRQAFAVVLRPGQAPAPADAIPITYTPRPGGGVVARFAPSTLRGLEHQTAIGMYIEFATGTGEAAVQRASFDFQYTPAGGIPARFTGTFSDAIVDGSVVVTAEVDVARAGPYLIDCNLYDAAGQPVAWTRFKAPLAAGRQRAPLVFFGKVLVDAGARGPFRIGQLRGARFDAGRDPDLEQMPPYPGAYETRAYTPDQFSSAEWDSPEKRKLIELLTQQQAAGRHQGAATPAPAGEPGDGQ